MIPHEPIVMTRAQIENARALIMELHDLEAKEATAMGILLKLCENLGFTHGGSLSAIEGRLAAEIGKQILAKGML